MGKKSPKTPEAPDPVLTSRLQNEQNLASARTNANLNRINTYTPYGSDVYTDLGNDKWSRTTSLNPMMQAGETAKQQGMTGLYQLGASKIPDLQTALGGPYQDFSDPSKWENALFARLDPSLKRDRESLETQLTNQGINRGTDAWNTAIGQEDQKVNDARQQAVLGAGQYGNQAFDLYAKQRAQPLQEVQGLFGIGNQNQPNQQYEGTPGVNVNPADITGALNTQYQGQLTGYNNQVATNNANTGATASVIAAALMAMCSKDFKRDDAPAEDFLSRLVTLPIRTWRYKGDEAYHIGPYAEDWAERFGGDGKMISLIDMFGVVIKSIQELNQKVTHA